MAVIRQLNNQYHKRGYRVCHIRWDKDSVFESHLMRQFCKDQGIIDCKIAGYSPQENGHAERAQYRDAEGTL
jgi:transposase InsO family protein